MTQDGPTPGSTEPPPTRRPARFGIGDIVERDGVEYITTRISEPYDPPSFGRGQPKIELEGAGPLADGRWHRQSLFVWKRRAPALVPFL